MRAAAAAPLVEVARVCKIFRNGTVVLADIDLAVLHAPLKTDCAVGVNRC